MADRSPLIIERRGAASWARIDRPHRGNACDTSVLEALDGWLDAATAEDGVRALVLTGTGDSFCLGADMAEGAQHLGDPEAILAYVARGRDLVERIAHAPLPVIAAVNGRALAGGFELVQAADFAIAVRGATLGDAHARHGVLPGWGSSARLPHLIGIRAATFLLATGAELPADDLHRLGALTDVVEEGELLGSVDALVEKLAAVPPATSTRLLELTRASRDEADGLAREWAALRAQVSDPELRAGVERFLG